VHPFSFAYPLPPQELADSGQAGPRRPVVTTYRCYLPVLTGFVGRRRAGPDLQRPRAGLVEGNRDLKREFDPAV